jgi:hypothetical protein
MDLVIELVGHVLDEGPTWTCTLRAELAFVEFPRCRACGQRCRSALVWYSPGSGEAKPLPGRLISCSQCNASDLMDEIGDTIFLGEFRVRL